MVNLKFSEFQIFAQGKIPNAALLTKGMSIALGVACAICTPGLPGTMEGSYTHYDTVGVYKVARLVADFNENILIDVDLSQEVARSFWLIKQNAGNIGPNSVVFPNGRGTFVEKVFGLNFQINPQVENFINENSEVMAVLVNRIVALIRDNPVLNADTGA